MTIESETYQYASGRSENIYTGTNYIFSIGIVVGKDPFHLSETKEIGNPVLTAGDVDAVDA